MSFHKRKNINPQGPRPFTKRKDPGGSSEIIRTPITLLLYTSKEIVVELLY